MESKQNKKTSRGSIFKLLGVIVFAGVCFYIGRQYVDDSKSRDPKDEASSQKESLHQEEMMVFDIKMSVLKITQEEDGFTEITTAGAPDLVSNRPGTVVALDTVSGAVDFMKKLLPENITFILSTDKGTTILKCTEITHGKTPNSLKFAFHQDETLQNMIKASKETQTESSTSDKKPIGTLLALSYAGFKKEDKKTEVPFPRLDRVNYLFTSTGVRMTKAETSPSGSPQNAEFPWKTSFLGVDKVVVVSIKGKEDEVSGEDFATKVWKEGADSFIKTPPNGNFEAQDQEGKDHFFALKFSHPKFEKTGEVLKEETPDAKTSNVLTFATEFLENEHGQKVIPDVFGETGTFESVQRGSVVVVIDSQTKMTTESKVQIKTATNNNVNLEQHHTGGGPLSSTIGEGSLNPTAGNSLNTATGGSLRKTTEEPLSIITGDAFSIIQEGISR